MEKDKEKERERNIVAEQQNWNQRVRTELDSARIWVRCAVMSILCFGVVVIC